MSRPSIDLAPTPPPSREDRRGAARTALRSHLLALVADPETQVLRRTRISGSTADISTSGALILTDEELPQRRVWICFEDSIDRLVECEVVRSVSAPRGATRAYGVKFTRPLSDAELATLIANNATASPAAGRPAGAE